MVAGCELHSGIFIEKSYTNRTIDNTNRTIYN